MLQHIGMMKHISDQVLVMHQGEVIGEQPQMCYLLHELANG